MTEVVEPIAVIGMAGRFPGAVDVDAFWDLLAAGREGVRALADDELSRAGVPADVLANPDYVKAIALCPDVERFDADLFGFTPREASLCDPQIRLFLETAHAALEQAGYDPMEVTEAGVFGAAAVPEYAAQHVRPALADLRSAAGVSLATLTNSDYLATLVSYKLNLRGPSLTVQTACSSSLVAVHLAVQALRSGECDLALAGGADVEFPFRHGHRWSRDGILSRDGHCRPFDAAASGTIFGSGVGIVVLKRLADATADGDHVDAVIRSVAVNNDGSEKLGFSSPGLTGQAAVATEALAMSGLQPDRLSYVEAHATGTVLGDPVEVAALTRAHRRLTAGDPAPRSCALGSVKGNVGHLGHAAGVTSLIKTVLALVHEQIPPTINVTRPNPRLELDSSPFFLATELRSWPREPGTPRLAGVNSTGIGGTNVHLVLEEGPVRQPVAPAGRPAIVLWSARSTAAELDQRARLAKAFAELAEDEFGDAVATLARGRTVHPVRAALVSSTPADAGRRLRGREVLAGSGPARPREPAFLFSGQGALTAGVGAGLHAAEPAFAAAFDDCAAAFSDVGVHVVTDAGSIDLTDTTVAQPLQFALQYAMARLLADWGIRPAAVIGHSLGEITAATVAGVLSLSDATAVVTVRARAMSEMPAGGMLAVAAAPDELGRLPAELVVAAHNGRRQSVVAGPTGPLRDLGLELRRRGVAARSLSTAHAFHSPAMTAAIPAVERAFAAADLRDPQVPIFSAATGQLLRPAEATDPAFWARQLVRPVRFAEALDALLVSGDRIMVGTGPDNLLGEVRRHPAARSGSHVAVATMPRAGADRSAEQRSVLTAVARLWVDGATADLRALVPSEFRRTPLPGFPYQRSRHWIDPPSPGPAATSATPVPGPADRPHEGTTAAAAPPYSVVTWVETDAVGDGPDRRPGPDAVVLLPEDQARAVLLLAAAHEAGLRVTPVRYGTEWMDGPGGFTIRPGVLEDRAALLARLAERGARPQVLVHGATLGNWEQVTARTVDGQLQRSFEDVLGWLQATARARTGTEPVSLVVVTEGSVDVSGGELLQPVKASLLGLLLTLAEEEPRAGATMIDLGAGVGRAALAAELRNWARSDVVALRGSRRWTRTERPYAVTEATTGTVLRRHGTYLITGGGGGLGRAVAVELARTGLEPRLILLSRTPPDESDPLIGQLSALGAVVSPLAGDVADARSLRRALDIATARHGHLHGIFHLAGTPGGGMLAVRSSVDAAAVLGPKVTGTVILAEVLADRPRPEFFVAFSSRASVGGLFGSGDYAAANACLDALAAAGTVPADRTVSISWPAWTDVGMTAAEQRPRPGKAERTWSILVGPDTDWMLDEHRLDRLPLLPGTGHLDLVLRAYRAEVTAGRATPVRVTDVVFELPLFVPGPRRVEVHLGQAGAAWRFEVWSDASGEHRRHSSGSIGPAEGGPRTVDLAALRARLTVTEPEPRAGRGALVLGPRWDSLEAIRTAEQGDRTELLATVALPAAFSADLDHHELHPALLDVATSVLRDGTRHAPHLPFGYESVELLAPLPSRFLSHVRTVPTGAGVLTADVVLCDEDGHLLADIRGFVLRRWDPEALDRQTPAEPAPGLSSSTGTRLLMELLDSRTPPHVAVRPFRAGRPVPLVVRSASSAAAEPVPAMAPGVGSGAAGESGPRPTLTRPDAPSGPPQPSPAAARPGPAAPAHLAALWTEALGVTDLGPDDDFFELGGDSLTAVELMSRVRDDLRVDLSITALFDHPTLAAFTEHVRRIGAE